MDFSEALKWIKDGSRVSRRGWNGRDWNGKGVWVGLQPGYPDGIPANDNTLRLTRSLPGTIVRVRPYLVMCAVDGTLVPWLASQTDLLADDWIAHVEIERVQ